MKVWIEHRNPLPRSPGTPKYEWVCHVSMTRDPAVGVEDFSGAGESPLAAALDCIHELASHITEETT